MKYEEPGWNYLILEGYCARKWSCKSGKHLYELAEGKDLSDKAAWKRIPNPCHDPKYRTPRKPKHCRNRITLECVKCPHFAYAEADEDILKLVEEYIKEMEEE